MASRRAYDCVKESDNAPGQVSPSLGLYLTFPHALKGHSFSCAVRVLFTCYPERPLGHEPGAPGSRPSFGREPGRSPHRVLVSDVSFNPPSGAGCLTQAALRWRLSGFCLAVSHKCVICVLSHTRRFRETRFLRRRIRVPWSCSAQLCPLFFDNPKSSPGFLRLYDMYDSYETYMVKNGPFLPAKPNGHTWIRATTYKINHLRSFSR